MKYRLSLIALPIATVALTAPAIACDMHGAPGLGGFHRYNPFAAAMHSYQDPEPSLEEFEVPPEVAEVEAAEKEAKNKKAKSKARSGKTKSKTKAKAETVTPVREWERDYGNGPVSEADKAIFT